MLERIAQSCFKFVVSELCIARGSHFGKNYANLQAVVKICQLFVSKLSTVIDSTNQILIPGAGIMERRHQWNVYRLPRVPLASLTESHSSLAKFFFRPRWEPVRRLYLFFFPLSFPSKLILKPTDVKIQSVLQITDVLQYHSTFF